VTTFAGNIAQKVMEKVAVSATCGWFIVLGAENRIDPTTPVGVPLLVTTMAAKPSENPIDYRSGVRG